MKIGKDGLSVAPPSNALLRRLAIFAKDLTIIVFVVSTYPFVEEGPGMVKQYWCPPILLDWMARLHFAGLARPCGPAPPRARQTPRPPPLLPPLFVLHVGARNLLSPSPSLLWLLWPAKPSRLGK